MATQTARKHKGVGKPTSRSPDQLADKVQLLKTVRNLDDQGFTAQEIGNEIGFSTPYTYILLMQAGRAQSAATEARVEGQRADVERLCKEGKAAVEIAQLVKISAQSVYRFVKEAGLEFAKVSRAQDRIARMREIAAAGGSQSDAAMELGCTRENIRQLAIRHGVAFLRKSKTGRR